MKASIIIPTYRPQPFVYECLDSVFAQTLEAEEFEVIIVLNGCNEPYLSELQAYLAQNKGEHIVKLIQTDTPGVSNARNIALDEAQGDYIFFVDDDDHISPTYMERLLDLSVEDGVVASKLRLYSETTGEEFYTNLVNAYAIALEEIKKRPLTLYTGRRFLSTVWGKSIPRGVIGDIRFNTGYALGEDSLFITALTKNIKHIYLAPEDAVYHVRKREQSASRKSISNWSQVANALSLAFEYLKMYASDIRHNSFLFYMSRVAASLLKAFLKRYRTV